jgi:hypothetical protein
VFSLCLSPPPSGSNPWLSQRISSSGLSTSHTTTNINEGTTLFLPRRSNHQQPLRATIDQQSLILRVSSNSTPSSGNKNDNSRKKVHLPPRPRASFRIPSHPPRGSLPGRRGAGAIPPTLPMTISNGSVASGTFASAHIASIPYSYRHISLETAADPCVTTCGHLFCWNDLRRVRFSYVFISRTSSHIPISG